MKKFLAVFTGSTAAQERSGWDALSDTKRAERQQKGIAAWSAWMEKNKAAVVEGGSPLGTTKRTGLNGVTDIKNIRGALEAMQRIGMPLLLHGEVTDKHVDIFDREAVFIDRILSKLIRDFPALKIVLEHITTEEAAVIGDDDSGAIAEGVASVLGRLCGVERCEINSNKCVSDGDADLAPNADTQLVGD